MKPINPITVGPLHPLDFVCGKIGCPNNAPILIRNSAICNNCILLPYNSPQRSKLRHFLGVVNEANQS